MMFTDVDTVRAELKNGNDTKAIRTAPVMIKLRAFRKSPECLILLLLISVNSLTFVEL